MGKAAPKPTAVWVVRRLRHAGYQALFAGGCVRDMLLGNRCSDYDVATDATPRQVKKLFGHVLLVGAKFGVAMVMHRGRKIEVATFRSDMSYSDGRRPDGVRFTTPAQDAKRRDFTINGMFCDPLTGEVIDYVGGQKDLRRGVIRCIGKPERRFGEDYLRMMRAVRFAVRLGFTIDPATAAAIRRNAEAVTAMSGERIFDELTKMLSAPSAPLALRRLAELDLARHVLGELAGDESLWKRGLARVEAVASGGCFAATLGALLAELPRRTIRHMMRRWGASNELRNAACFLAGNLSAWRNAETMALCDFKRLMAADRFDNLLQFWRAQERLETGGRALSLRARRRADAIPRSRVSPQPLVTGADLKRIGLAEGPRMGQILRVVYDAQLNEQLRTRRSALAKARKLAGC